jgi:two-component system, LytTR family, response regulator LytT
MTVVIIEDELLTAEDLADILLKLAYGIKVIKILQSVAEAVDYFKQHDAPDLIFCDIQLGDGFSFEIFKQTQLQTPVIFCTAYNEYALEAFRNNGIDYVLKPFTKKSIKEAVEKYKNLQTNLSKSAIDYDGLLKNLQTQNSQAKKVASLLISFKDKIIPIKIADIAMFEIGHKLTQLSTFDNQHFYVNHTLEELEEICGENFYRANRQYLINRDVVAEALQYFARKLVLRLKIEGNHEIIISKSKVPEFLSWLRQ